MLKQKKFKRIYIEITNICNLSCSFCSLSKRSKRELTVGEFEHILKEINYYTNYLYLHVKGEPLIHSKLSLLLDLCHKYQKKVNITTNGTLIRKQLNTLKEHNCVRQINISLHSENDFQHYLEDIFESVEQLSKEKYIVYRFWTMKDKKLDKKSQEIIEKIVSYYQLDSNQKTKIYSENNIKIKDTIYINKGEEFVWPDENNSYYEEHGYCHALTDQVAILSDGTVVACCLDGEGKLKLGNIFQESFFSIINSTKYNTILQGFQNRKVTENLCKHCSFKSKF